VVAENHEPHPYGLGRGLYPRDYVNYEFFINRATIAHLYDRIDRLHAEIEALAADLQTLHGETRQKLEQLRRSLVVIKAAGQAETSPDRTRGVRHFPLSHRSPGIWR
jgi:hypothetical protein